jgi:hypothetical protein
MEPQSIGICNELSYEVHHKQSNQAISYLNWLAFKHDVEIQHALTSGGEIRLKLGHLLDGYVPEGLEKSGIPDIIEVHG